MAEIKVYLSNSLSDRFRRIAMSVYGYGRGSLSKAAEDAFSKWCAEHDAPAGPMSQAEPESATLKPPEPKESHVDPDERKVASLDLEKPAESRSQVES